jgi:hypothetical protein
MMSPGRLFEKLDQAFTSSRRGFLANLGVLVAGGFWGEKDATEAQAENSALTSSRSTEPLFEDSIQKEHDLVVVGGGISGLSAAISAARNGLDVGLVHNRAMFGGNSSSEVKLYPENNPGFDPWIKAGGIHEEIHLEERVRNHGYYLEGTMNVHWDLVLYEWVHREDNITPYLNTHMHRAIMADEATIDAVYAIQLGTNKSYELSAPLFVDASGDGNLGYRAGADFKWGREGRAAFDEPLAPAEADEKVMGNTLFFTARDTGRPVPFKRPDWAVEFESEDELHSRGHHHRGPEDSGVNGGYWWIEIGAPYHPIEDMNEARHEGLRQLLGVWDHIKNKGDHGAENYGLEFAGFWPYKREARRIRGDYVLTQHDVQNPKELEDAVAYGVWHIDIHVQGGILARQKEPVMWGDFQTLGTMVYSIPLRALYSRSVDNLFMAGRPISCSYLAFASTRVLSTGSICGQAAGVAAALAKKYETMPREIAENHAKECQQLILRQDGHIPGVVNEDPDDLARTATATASSESVMVFPDPEDSRELEVPHAQLFPVSESQIDRIELLLRSERSQPTELRVGLRAAPSTWDFRSEADLAVARAMVPAHYDGWVAFDFNAQVEPRQLYYIYTDVHEGIFWQSYSDSDERPSQVPVGTTAAHQPEKPPRSEQSPAFRETYPPTALADLPGTGENGRWEPLTEGVSLCTKISPKSYPYGARNVNHGTNRPDQWSNIWISDPTDTLPDWVQLEWATPQRFNTVQLTFDTNQNYRVTRPLYRYPECVKDYVLEYHDGGAWSELLRETDNYMRRKVHRFDSIQTDRLRVRVLATNGIGTAHIYEVRVYDEE